MTQSGIEPLNETAEQPVSDVTIGSTRITVLGTAHVSRVSADAVREMLAQDIYDAVAIELCRSRHHAMTNPDSLAKMDLFQVLREKKASTIAASLALGAFQQRIAEQFGIEPGAEMRAAIEIAEEKDLPVLLIDREIGTTLKRVYRSVPWWKRLYLVTGLFASLVSREEVSEEDLERLKEGDMLESTFSQFAEESRELYLPLIDERDQYMAARLLEEAKSTTHKHILAVVGAGHLKGITQYLNQPIKEPGRTIAELDTLPPPGKWGKRIPWLIVAIIVTGFAIGFMRSPELGWQLVADWVLINGGLSALGAAIAGAHPLTIIGAFVAAPLTSLNPTVGAGMVTGALEAYLRKPRVGDFSRLRQDASRLKGWWQNRVTRVLLVFIFSTIGSAAGTWIAGFTIFDRLTG